MSVHSGSASKWVIGQRVEIPSKGDTPSDYGTIIEVHLRHVIIDLDNGQQISTLKRNVKFLRSRTVKGSRLSNPSPGFSHAQKLFRDFHEREARIVEKIAPPRNARGTVMVLGELNAVEYDTPTRKNYRHVFARASRPLLCTDGRQLFILKGRYRVTARGIVDLNARGVEE